MRVAINTGVVLILVAAAGVFGWVIVFEKVPQQIAVVPGPACEEGRQLQLPDLFPSPVFSCLIQAASGWKQPQPGAPLPPHTLASTSSGPVPSCWCVRMRICSLSSAMNALVAEFRGRRGCDTATTCRIRRGDTIA